MSLLDNVAVVREVAEWRQVDLTWEGDPDLRTWLVTSGELLGLPVPEVCLLDGLTRHTLLKNLP
jgi:hypothetical protein